jgi:hypothetical protein
MWLSVRALILAAGVATEATAAGPIRQLPLSTVVWTAGKNQARAECISTWARYWRCPLAVSEIQDPWRRSDSKVLIFPSY